MDIFERLVAATVHVPSTILAMNYFLMTNMEVFKDKNILKQEGEGRTATKGTGQRFQNEVGNLGRQQKCKI